MLQQYSDRKNSEVVAEYSEHFVSRVGQRLYARDYPGQEPAIILMHGFPDNLHLYDRLVPYLKTSRRVITFDFLGWGQSDKPQGHAYTADNQTLDLAAIIAYFKLRQVVLVAHDASGPPAIDWALAHSEQVASLVLLNCYYSNMPGLKAPEAIFLFSTPLLRTVARLVSTRFDLFRRLYWWQVGRFIRDKEIRDLFVPLLYRQFEGKAGAKTAFFGLNQDLLKALKVRNHHRTKLQEFKRPVRIIFGEADKYLNARVARTFQALFAHSELFLLDGAKHFVQLDEPEKVANLILTAPASV